MTNFGILVKSHAPDHQYVARLVRSLGRHNVDSVPVFIIVPDFDLPLFSEFASAEITVLGESTLLEHLVSEPLAGFSAGYVNQEIIKLSFWETGLADNYLCLDSDAEFVRDFQVSDFMFDESTPYTFLTEDAELISEPEYFVNSWQGRADKLKLIKETVGVSDPRILTVHGHAVFSASVLKSFKSDFLEPRGWSYRDAVGFSPYEPTWYSMWLQRDHTIPIHVREPNIKTFHNATQHLAYVLQGKTRDDVKRGYVAVVVNSNYSRGDGVIGVDEPPHLALASYLTTREILKALWCRARRGVTPRSRRKSAVPINGQWLSLH